jgi:predicted class III extradiol MEMO1 family dioxygenase
MNHPIRPAAVAGSWYPGSAPALAAAVDRHLAHVDRALVGDLVAIVSPHAGLMYSGPVAAQAYGLLRDRHFEMAILVGPSHFVGFDGVAVVPTGGFETPFGVAPIDAACASDLMGATPLIHDRPAAVLQGRRALLVASTDLSHYHDAATAARLDDVVIDCVSRFSADALQEALDRRPEHACGGGPTVAVMRAATLLGARDAVVLDYADSGDVSGDKSAVVGYMAAAFGNFTKRTTTETAETNRGHG